MSENKTTNRFDNGMGPGPGVSASDCSGSPEPRYCDGCGAELGTRTPAQWRATEECWACGDDPHEIDAR